MAGVLWPLTMATSGTLRAASPVVTWSHVVTWEPSHRLGQHYQRGRLILPSNRRNSASRHCVPQPLLNARPQNPGLPRVPPPVIGVHVRIEADRCPNPLANLVTPHL